MTADVQMIMARKPDGKMGLWACRGSGKGCKRNLTRGSAKPCDDCLGPLSEKMTMGEIVSRLKTGDA